MGRPGPPWPCARGRGREVLHLKAGVLPLRTQNNAYKHFNCYANSRVQAVSGRWGWGGGGGFTSHGDWRSPEDGPYSSFFLDLQGSLTILRLSKNHCSPSGPLGPPRPLSFPSQALPGPLGLFQALRFTSAAYSQPYTVLIPPRSPQQVLRTTFKNLRALQHPPVSPGLSPSKFSSVPSSESPRQLQQPQDSLWALLSTSLSPRPLGIPSSPMVTLQSGAPGFPFRSQCSLRPLPLHADAWRSWGPQPALRCPLSCSRSLQYSMAS